MKQKHRFLQRVAGVALALLMMLLWGPGAVWAQAGRDIGLPLQSAQFDTAEGDVQADPPVESPVEPPAPPAESPVVSPVESPVESPSESPVAPDTVEKAAGMKLGCVNPASLGDYLWYDSDKDGIQDAGESGVNNAEVKLYQGSTYIGHDYTDHSGKYLFNDLEAGAYRVKFPDISGYAFTHQDAGSDDAKDSDAGNDGYAASVTLAAGQNVTTVDAGYVCKTKCKLGDYLWYDVNGNGIQDSGESGISGVTVQLYQGGNAIASDTTSGSGKYEFDDLDAGAYQVKFPAVSGKAFTVKDAGSDDGKDSDAGTGGMTGDITLFWGDSNMTVDCGYRVPAQLGDFVWLDTDEDGIQDAGEAGIGSVSVELYSGSTKVGTTTTAANGSYQFTGLDAGSYKVKFPTLANKAFTTANAGGNDAKDSDADATGYTGNVTLAWGDCNTTIDCGYVDRTPAQLGDFVWLDADEDGIQDAGEAGIGGVSVELYNGSSLAGTTTTAGNGSYLFTGLGAGTYKVKFPALTNKAFTTANAGGDDAKDSDMTSIGFTQNVTLAWGGSNLTVDCGYVDRTPAQLGDFVWLDTDEDGIQDGGEAGVGGVSVELYTSASVYVATATTAGNGSYLFTGLNAGTYKVKFPALTNKTFTTANAGSDDAKDSDMTSAGFTQNVTLAWGGSNLTVDCGYVDRTPAQLGDFVWLDTDEDGIQDGGENGISGVTVELYSGSSLVTSTVTAADGSYHFTGLNAGAYKVRFPVLTNRSFTLANAGGNDGKDSDADATGYTGNITLAWGETNNTVDCGYIDSTPIRIGDYVWLDQDKDGIQDSNEPGVPGVTVKLHHGNEWITTTTNSNGYYLFTDVAPGTWQVVFYLPADGTMGYSGFSFTTKHAAGSTVDNDSNVNPAGENDTQQFHPGDVVLNIDAGLVADWGSIGDFTWQDNDRDGVQDAGEPGLPGILVKLYSVNGDSNTMLTWTYTDANGAYFFNFLPYGTYQLKFAVLADWEHTIANAGADNKDSDAEAGGYTANVVLSAANANDMTVDAGYVRPFASLGDFVWYDVDGNGVQDGTDGIFGGVTVELYQGGVLKAATTSDASGLYHFTGLDAGTYQVKFADKTASGFGFTTRDAGSDDALDSDAAATGYTADVTLAWGENNTTVDCGYVALPKASLGDFVWLDTNYNGYQDAGEPGISGLTVELYQGTVVKATTTTDASGLYHFTGLDAGSYVVKFYAASGMFLSSADLGDDAHDSDAGVDGRTPAVTLTWGENNTTVDCGMAAPGTVGNFVWLDTNKNGIQDPGEPAVPGVPVDLYKDSVVVGSMATDSSGFYVFTGLLPGAYHVQLSLPPDGTLGYTGFAFTTQCVSGGTEATDSNPDAAGVCASLFLHSGETVDTMDAGLVADWGSIGDFVWVDTDKDGLQDVVESGLGGVTVNLFSVNGSSLTLKASTVTDSVGHYLFTLLPMGDYKVQFIKPATYDQTLLEAGAEIMDSDAGLDGYTADVVLNAGQRDDLNQDAGYVKSTCSLGDRVWLDTNWNGVQDTGEPGVNGITVELYKDGTATPIASTVTASHGGQDGWYLFEGLENGSYRIKVIVNAAQYLLTSANVGADDADSDTDVSGYSPWVALDIAANRNDVTVDAGLEIPCSIGDYVWLDKPKTGLPGVQESDEPGHNGVKVALYRQVNGVMQFVTSTITATHEGKAGWYSFSGLQEGVYQVKFIILEDGYELVPSHVGSDDARDSDAGALGLTPLITLSVTGNRNDVTIDAGVRIPSTGGLPAGIFYGAGGTLLLAGAGLSLPFFLRRRQRIMQALRLFRLRLTALLVRK